MVSRLEYSISKTWDTHRELSRKNFSYPYNFIRLYFSHGSQTVRTLSFQDSVSHPRGLGGGRGATQEFLGGDLPLGRTLRYCRPLVRLFATTPHTRLMHIIFFKGRTAMPRWWAPIRAKQLSMADTALNGRAHARGTGQASTLASASMSIWDSLFPSRDEKERTLGTRLHKIK